MVGFYGQNSKCIRIIELYGRENFVPHVSEEFTPTTAPAGSRQKIDVLAERIQRGMPLWHPEDSTIQLILSLLVTLPEYESKIHLVAILKISQFFNLKRLAYFCI